MKKIRIYFYRPALDGHLLDNAISFVELVRTYPKFLLTDWKSLKKVRKLRTSHTEFCDWEYRMMYTSTMRYSATNKADGVVKRPCSEVLTNKNRWYYYEISVHNSSYRYGINWAEFQVFMNEGYDKRAIVKFVTGPFTRRILEFILRTKLNDNKKWICSGFNFHVLSHIIMLEAVEYNQCNILHESLTSLKFEFKGYEPDPLSLSLCLSKAGLVPKRAIDDKPMM